MSTRAIATVDESQRATNGGAVAAPIASGRTNGGALGSSPCELDDREAGIANRAEGCAIAVASVGDDPIHSVQSVLQISDAS